jgi:hypothetical protein
MDFTIEDFKEDLKKSRAFREIDSFNDWGGGYLQAMEKYENLILFRSYLHVKDKDRMIFQEWRRHNKIMRLQSDEFLDTDGNIMTFKEVNKIYLEYIKL